MHLNLRAPNHRFGYFSSSSYSMKPIWSKLSKYSQKGFQNWPFCHWTWNKAYRKVFTLLLQYWMFRAAFCANDRKKASAKTIFVWYASHSIFLEKISTGTLTYLAIKRPAFGMSVGVCLCHESFMKRMKSSSTGYDKGSAFLMTVENENLLFWERMKVQIKTLFPASSANV